MRKLASICTIAKTEPVKDSDRLDVIHMAENGWQVVTGRNEFKKGDLIVFFEIDSYLNPNDERFAFLKDRCLRKIVSKSGNVLQEGIKIKTVKLRGCLSQGLVMGIDHFPEVTNLISTKDDGTAELLTKTVNEDGSEGEVVAVPLIGADVTRLLKVEHYDEVVERYRPAMGGSVMCADAYGDFPSAFIPKTDETRCHVLLDWWDKYKGMTFEVTEKNDGGSVTCFYSPMIDAENPLGVCSRNIRLKDKRADGGIPVPWQVIMKLGIPQILKDEYEKNGLEYALQGELVGPGINSDRDKYDSHEWHVFKIYDVKNQKFLLPNERRAFCAKHNIPHVQVVDENLDVFNAYPTCDDLLKYAEGKTVRGNEREGVVFKSNTVRDLSFKAVSNRYLLKSNE